uniref:Uncharacterized protein n=1 Tax=Marseillevirus LCMAC201 TaxID=2506605 RepID=A0A481YVV0_9VIRU|nr:MAG: hypothetical protein LCMAC201_02380 [Marseillevirus LCMAC201]
MPKQVVFDDTAYEEAKKDYNETIRKREEANTKGWFTTAVEIPEPKESDFYTTQELWQ